VLVIERKTFGADISMFLEERPGNESGRQGNPQGKAATVTTLIKKH
jgi:hypothetical protein